MIEREKIVYRELDDTIDFEQIHNLLVAAHAGNEAVDFDTTNVSKEEFLKKMGEGTVFTATYDDRLAGIMMVAPTKKKGWYVKGGCADLRFLAVYPEFAGNGIASRLISCCLGWAGDHGIKTAVWTTAYNNAAAIATAVKNGFIIVDYMKFRSVRHPSVRMARWIGVRPPAAAVCKAYYLFKRTYTSIRSK